MRERLVVTGIIIMLLPFLLSLLMGLRLALQPLTVVVAFLIGVILVYYGMRAEKKEQVSPTIMPPPISEQVVKREEITRKEVIVKIRCQYCARTYDETLDNCPYCGAKR